MKYRIEELVNGNWSIDRIGDGNSFNSFEEAQKAMNDLEKNLGWDMSNCRVAEYNEG